MLVTLKTTTLVTIVGYSRDNNFVAAHHKIWNQINSFLLLWYSVYSWSLTDEMFKMSFTLKTTTLVTIVSYSRDNNFVILHVRNMTSNHSFLLLRNLVYSWSLTYEMFKMSFTSKTTTLVTIVGYSRNNDFVTLHVRNMTSNHSFLLWWNLVYSWRLTACCWGCCLSLKLLSFPTFYR